MRATLLPLLAIAAAGALEVPDGVLALAARAEAPCGGSAVLVAPDLALTLDEALPGPGATVAVVLPGGRRGEAVVERRGASTTAVALRLRAAPGLRPLACADPRQARLGTVAWTAGNAAGAIELDGAPALSRGGISGRYDLPADAPPLRGRGGRLLSAYTGPLLETDAAVNDGSEGGALLDDAGRLLGLVTMASARERRMGGAVPIDRICADLGLAAPGAAPAPLRVTGAERAEVAAAAVVLLYLERPAGLGNPQALPRPPRAVGEVPVYERSRLQEWWDAYYHQQQVFWADHPVPALVVGPDEVLTAASNLHGGAEGGRVLLPGGAVSCRVVASHHPLDLVLLRAERPLGLPAAGLGAVAPALGEAVAVVGRHRPDAGPTLCAGVVSAVGRKAEQSPLGFVQIDARANYGSLGAPVIDAGGAVVGLTVLMGPERSWVINSGVTLAVDAPTIVRVLPGLRQGSSTAKSPVLGLGVQFSPRHASEGRLVLQSVVPGTGAAAAGLKPDDEILAIDGRPVASALAASRQLLRHRAGERAEVRLRRQGKELTVPVEIREFAP